jgi:hypothetical protein
MRTRLCPPFRVKRVYACMRRDSFAAGFWCALLLVGLLLVARREEPRVQTIQPIAAPMIQAARVVPETAPPPEPSLPKLHLPPPVSREAVYVGNVSTHRFHELSCRYASCRNCTVRFATRAEAIDQGFRPGGCCDP